VLGYLRLEVEERAIRVDANGNEHLRRPDPIALELLRVIGSRDGMEIHDAVDGVVVVLEPNPVLERAEVVPQVDVARW